MSKGDKIAPKKSAKKVSKAKTGAEKKSKGQKTKRGLSRAASLLIACRVHSSA